MSKQDGFEIVQANHKHLDVLVPLFDAYRVFYKEEPDLEKARVFLHERTANLESVIFLAAAGEHGLGFLQMYPSFDSLEMKRLWILHDIFVTPDARRRGIGRALMEHAQTFALESGAAGLTLATAVDNVSAQAFYESLGWVRDEMFYHYDLYF